MLHCHSIIVSSRNFTCILVFHESVDSKLKMWTHVRQTLSLLNEKCINKYANWLFCWFNFKSKMKHIWTAFVSGNVTVHNLIILVRFAFAIYKQYKFLLDYNNKTLFYSSLMAFSSTIIVVHTNSHVTICWWFWQFLHSRLPNRFQIRHKIAFR